MGGQKKMLQSCTTELAELCAKLEKEFNLPTDIADEKTVLQGDTFRISQGIEADGHERITYKDKVVTASFSDSRNIYYNIKGKYLLGQKRVLNETRLGRRILNALSIVSMELSEEKVNRSNLVADVDYQNIDEVYDLIKIHILA
jgi:hypothetical protein